MTVPVAVAASIAHCDEACGAGRTTGLTKAIMGLNTDMRSSPTSTK